MTISFDFHNLNFLCQNLYFVTFMTLYLIIPVVIISNFCQKYNTYSFFLCGRSRLGNLTQCKSCKNSNVFTLLVAFTMNLYLIFNLYLIKQTHLQWNLTASMGEKKYSRNNWSGLSKMRLTQIWLSLTVFTTPFLLLTIMVQHNNF